MNGDQRDSSTPSTNGIQDTPPGEHGLANGVGGELRNGEATRKRSHVAPALVSLDRVLDDDTFRIRESGDASRLATDLARLGQLFPVELRLRPPDRFQVVCGFRRVEALKFLQRDKVLARLHTDLSDEDALLMALAEAIHSQPTHPEDLERVRRRLEAEGTLTAAARDMLDKALTPDDSLAPEQYDEADEQASSYGAAEESPEGDAAGSDDEQEVDADELAMGATMRLAELNQDLSLLGDVFPDLDDERKQELLTQLAYAKDLLEFLGGK